MYTGELASCIGAIDVEVEIGKSDELPSLRLLNIPDKLKPISPHIGSNGSLCYASKGSIALDIFRPASQILACLDRATEVLDQILRDERVQDLADEFFVYWSSSDFGLTDLKSNQSQFIRAGILTRENGKETSCFVLSDSPELTTQKLTAMGYGANSLPCGACVISTRAEPRPLLNSNVWPPKTVSELLAWQRQLDRNCASKLLKKLERIVAEGHKSAIVLFVSPTSQYAAGISFPKAVTFRGKHKHVQEAIFCSEVKTLMTMRIDDHYVVERNQPGRESLMGKRILLIGCGTIGGYLAELLIKSGAGIGNGEFVLVDTDYISSGNIGRHRLGFNNMFKNKAEALAKELVRALPTANIVGQDVDAREMNLESFDIVINASGEQALADLLSVKTNRNTFTPILHCWIEGSGIAVRSMLQDSQKSACYRCLCDDDRVPLYPATTEPYQIQMAGHGCESLYVQFPASVSAMAAALAAEHVLDWVNKQPGPRFRTVIINRAYQSEHLNVDPIKQLQCPACAS